eukprot:TRINITY_DN58005_c0_g1_i1.p1 TRINITY_DN58005_c0_g1~~TRINITY_DN58005_c0_g1_i1.p1  ORF type:complete len:401 (+),score=56.66 TRINITY_DN58005_c0_g1_i1:274-1476(+)
MSGLSIGNCRLLTACYVENACPTEPMGEVCEVIRSMQSPVVPGHSTQTNGRENDVANAWVRKPTLWPQLEGRSRLGADDSSSAVAETAASSSRSSCDLSTRRNLDPLDGGFAMRENLASAFPKISSGFAYAYDAAPLSWRRECDRQRARVAADKALVNQVSGWGPEAGTIVDIHTGRHRPVTYWLRSDVRALCIFDREGAKVQVYPCNKVERCEDVAQSEEITARTFFLGLDKSAMRRGMIVTMDRQVYGRQVMSQGRVGTLNAKVFLLCKERKAQKLLRAAINVLAAELMVRDKSPTTCDAFRQLPDPAAFEVPTNEKQPRDVARENSAKMVSSVQPEVREGDTKHTVLEDSSPSKSTDADEEMSLGAIPCEGLLADIRSDRSWSVSQRLPCGIAGPAI